MILKNNKNTIYETKHLMVETFHTGVTWDVRSKPTKGGHTNQCTYGIDRNLIRFQRPAAGTADYKECRFPIFDCKEHKEHDVDPYSLAVKLGRMDDYYSIRPTIY